MNIKPANLITIIVLGMAGGSIYCLPYLKYVFYDQMILNMGITNDQCGLLMTVYAIAGILVYFPGGVISDRVSSKLSIVGSLFAASALTYLFAFNPTNFTLSLGVWFGLAFACVFLCWPAIMKTVRVLGGENVSTAYSIYYAANGVTGGLINWIALYIYNSNSSHADGFFWAMILIAGFTTVIPFLVLLLLRGYKEEKSASGSSGINFSGIKLVLTNPKIWLLSGLLFCTYTIYTAITYLTPYLTGVFHIDPELSGNLSIVRLFLFMLLAPISGMLADKVFKSVLRWYLVALAFIAAPTCAMFIMGESMSTILVCTITLVPAFFASGLYSIMFSTLNECRIPVSLAGTAIGVVSIFTFLPDMIIHTFFGMLLDSYGVGAWDLIWKFTAIVCAAAFVISAALIRINRTAESEDAPEPVPAHA